ncbi:GNAT family N-acetyltransferase [Nocardioides sp.]|uniref:GNAT family N-acetyltransferase n=1 Tax=Nocardioides sp. TaxID=35761 RepID=UPI003D12DA8D
MRTTLDFLADPAEFLAAAGEHLALDPVIGTVVTTIADRAVREVADGIGQPPEDWWLVVRDEAGAVVGAGMRTAPFGSRPAFLLPMPDEAAVALAAVLHDRGEEMLAVNGALPAARICADELARRTSACVRVAQHTRLFELVDLVAPRPVPGTLMRATRHDLDLALAWFAAFMSDADEQAGRPAGSSAHEAPTEQEMLRRIDGDRIWFWVDDAGERVHLTGTNPPSFGVARIGPVYTPPDQRGRGFASAAVAAVSQQIIDGGARACLFTDQANPTSNHIYTELGYRPVVDMANHVIE